MQKNDPENKKNHKKLRVLLLICGTLALCALVAVIVIYSKAEPKVKLGDYKNMTVSLSEAEKDTNLAAPDGLGLSSSKDEKLKQAVLSELVKISKFSFTGKAVELRYNDFMKYYKQMTALYDDYKTIEDLAVKYYGYESLSAFEKAVKDYAEASVKQELALAAVAKAEGFAVNDEIFNKYIKNYLKAYDYGENEVEAFLENYGREDVYAVILDDYTLDMLVSWTKVE